MNSQLVCDHIAEIYIHKKKEENERKNDCFKAQCENETKGLRQFV